MIVDFMIGVLYYGSAAAAQDSVLRGIGVGLPPQHSCSIVHLSYMSRFGISRPGNGAFMAHLGVPQARREETGTGTEATSNRFREYSE
jgi:hypothetical protein